MQGAGWKAQWWIMSHLSLPYVIKISCTRCKRKVLRKSCEMSKALVSTQRFGIEVEGERGGLRFLEVFFCKSFRHLIPNHCWPEQRTSIIIVFSKSFLHINGNSRHSRDELARSLSPEPVGSLAPSRSLTSRHRIYCESKTPLKKIPQIF